MTAPGVIERYAAAWQRSDLDTMFAIHDPDVVVHYGGASQFAGDHHGRDALIALLTETGRRGGRTLVSVDAITTLVGTVQCSSLQRSTSTANA